MKCLAKNLMAVAALVTLAACQQVADGLALVTEGVQQVCDAVAPPLVADAEAPDLNESSSKSYSPEATPSQDPNCSGLV